MDDIGKTIGALASAFLMIMFFVGMAIVLYWVVIVIAVIVAFIGLHLFNWFLDLTIEKDDGSTCEENNSEMAGFLNVVQPTPVPAPSIQPEIISPPVDDDPILDLDFNLVPSGLTNAELRVKNQEAMREIKETLANRSW